MTFQIKKIFIYIKLMKASDTVLCCCRSYSTILLQIDPDQGTYVQRTYNQTTPTLLE